MQKSSSFIPNSEKELTSANNSGYGKKESLLFDNPLWDIHKTSQMLSVSEKTLRDWVYKRSIPFKKIGNLVRFEPSAIRLWIEERNKHGHSTY